METPPLVFELRVFSTGGPQVAIVYEIWAHHEQEAREQALRLLCRFNGIPKFELERV